MLILVDKLNLLKLLGVKGPLDKVLLSIREDNEEEKELKVLEDVIIIVEKGT